MQAKNRHILYKNIVNFSLIALIIACTLFLILILFCIFNPINTIQIAYGQQLNQLNQYEIYQIFLYLFLILFVLSIIAYYVLAVLVAIYTYEDNNLKEAILVTIGLAFLPAAFIGLLLIKRNLIVKSKEIKNNNEVTEIISEEIE
ncbi:hypothetical protein [Mycoplasma tauri]|uniref:Uncharacterized protein n=1 Tax=Mycoplasma tauri TaxID=547987 RepID=A0A953NCJ5_9MOLU|nr:hypothetical protein [Mycoplasma tauri]MBZ4195366.1 hypothetical protein [Mycoplasma tauri]MBZ4212504.1 hypothetical protein [Mycoplasma tauri]MBZ4218262.1 hypothetical protein [Mycoplasma tauri]